MQELWSRGRANWWRVGGAAGIAFVILFVISLVIQGTPPLLDDPIDDVRESFDDAYLVGDYLGALAFVFFFLYFLSALRALLGRAEGGAGTWSRTAYAAGIVGLVLGGAGSTFGLTLALRGGETWDDSTVRLLTDLSTVAFSSQSLVMGAFVLASSVVIIQTEVLWRWLGWAGLVAALLGTVGAAWLIDGDDEGFLAIIQLVGLGLILIWVLLVGIAMVLKESLDPEVAERSAA